MSENKEYSDDPNKMNAASQFTQKKSPLSGQIQTSELVTITPKTHTWVRECTNKVDEAATDFVYQCVVCGLFCVDDYTSDPTIPHCVDSIVSRYCGYCKEFQWLDDFKFHSINADDNTLFCDVREHFHEQHKEFLESKKKK